MPSGYSVLLYHPPEHYWDLFSDLPEKLEVTEEIPSEGPVDFIHLFCSSWDELTAISPQ